MSKLSELLFGRQDTGLQELQPQYSPEMQAYLNDVGNQDYMKKLLAQNPAKALTLDQYKEGIAQGLNFGVPEIAQKQKELGINIPVTGEDKFNASMGQFNQYPMVRTGITNEPQGGLLNDLARGYNENYNNRFAIGNLAPNQDKNWATRIGEGLGTVGRFIDSPLGRGLIAGGLNSALGYNNSLREGLTAAVGRQNYQTQDRLFRQQLKNDYGYTDEDLDNIRGNVTKDMFNSLALSSYRTRSLRVRQDIANASDNTKRANIIMQGLNNGVITPQEAQVQMANYGITLEDLQKSNATINAEINKYLAPHKARAYDTGAIVGMGNLGINSARLKHQIDQDNFENQLKVNNSPVASLNAIKDQMDRFSNSFGNVSKGKGGAIASELKTNAGFGNQAEVNFNSQKQLLFNKIARDLGGEKGVLSDQDIARIKEALPNLSDSYSQKQAKMKAVYDLLDDRMSQYGVKSNSGSGKTKSGVKYKVVK